MKAFAEKVLANVKFSNIVEYRGIFKRRGGKEGVENKEIYFLFTDTGSLLAKAINHITGHSYNHVSIGFDEALRELYSFGRKNEKNPFIGGFVKENKNCDFLKNAVCEIYSCKVTADEYEIILQNIKEIEARSNHYKYNFIGLFGILLQIEINRKCRSEEHTSELQSRGHLVCRLLLEKKKYTKYSQ